MKHFGRSSLLFASSALTAVWLLTATAQAASPGAAVVKKVVGSATYTDARGGGPIKENDILMQGATITTGAGSYVDLDLGVNGNALRVEADSTLALSKLDYAKAGEVIINTELDVQKGSTVANVTSKLSKASKYEIKTPAGVAGIRGTTLRAGSTGIQCLIGRIQFVVSGSKVQLVISGGAGYQVGGTGVARLNSVQTTGLARTATALTANALGNMVTQAVQQFTAAIAAEAATEAGKNGNNAAAAAEAAAVAKTVLAQLLQEVKAAADNAPPAVRAAVQQAVAGLEKNSDSVGATAAASAAAAAVVNNGGNAQQAKAAADQAAGQATTDKAIAKKAGDRVTTGAINQAILDKTAGGGGDVTETIVNRTRSADAGNTDGGKGKNAKSNTGTKVGETTFTSPTI